MKQDFQSLTNEKLGRRVFVTAAILAGLSGGGAGPAHAKPASSTLTFSIQDPMGDPTGTIDVTRMDMSFDTKNGKYTIVLTADPARPFTGQFRVNINLYDPSVLSRDPSSSSSVFQADCKSCGSFSPKVNRSDFDLGSATTTTLTLATEGSAALKAWQAGDQVSTHSLGNGPLGNPPGTALFRSSVDTNPLAGGFLTSEDVIGYNDQTGDGSSGVATLAVGP